MNVTAQAITMDRASFDRDGYVLLPDLVNADQLHQLCSEADTVFEERVRSMLATRQRDDRVTWWRLPSGQPYVLKIKPVLDLAPAAGALARGQLLTGLATSLLATQVELMEDKLMYKREVPDWDAGWTCLPVLGEEVCKHTDAAYFAARGFGRVLTIAVCLDPCTAESGAIRVWPGTHRQPTQMVPTPHQGLVVPDHAAPDQDAILLTAEPGTVLAWDAALVHASGPNTSGRPRRLLVLGYASTSA